MNKLSERRLIENEIVFRARNMAVNDFVSKDERHEGARLDFYCECSYMECRERIRLTPEEYEKLHGNKKQFIVLDGHELLSIEKIIEKRDGYNVIEKFKVPDEAGI